MGRANHSNILLGDNKGNISAQLLDFDGTSLIELQ